MRHITEREYIDYTDRMIHGLASAIARSGLSIRQIARETRMRWETVYNASQGIQVRFETACRLHYFLEEARKEKEKLG